MQTNRKYSKSRQYLRKGYHGIGKIETFLPDIFSN